MKNLFRAMRLEIRASLRQLSSTISLNTVERILLVAFAVLMSAVLGYLRLTGLSTELVLGAVFAASLLLGGLIFNRGNALELTSGEKAQALRILPMRYRILRFVKLEKLLFASALVYGAVSGYLLAILLLSGYGGGAAFAHTLCAVLAFCLTQNVRALLLNVDGKLRWLKYPGLAALLGGCAWTVQKELDWNRLLCGACGFYVQNCAWITLGLAGALALVKLIQLCGQTTDCDSKDGEVTLGISARMERLLCRANDVTRRDLQGILHSPKERRAFLGRILMPALTALLSATLLRTGILSVSLRGSLSLWMLTLMIASSNAKLFERQMTMGYEGGMIIAYVLSGRRISQVQLQRLRGSLVIAGSLTLAEAMAMALILGQGALATLLALALGAANCGAVSCINAYYLVKGTSYCNDLNRPRFSSGLVLQALCTGLEMLLILPLTLLELTPASAAQFGFAAAYAGICGLLALIYTRRIKKGDAHFYGEYQGIAA